MDTLTHALSGALLARATGTRQDVLPLRTRLLAGFLAAAFPDADVVLGSVLDPLTYINAHRGATHSLLLMPLWALLLAALFARWKRLPWRAFYGVCLGALAIHIAGDVITSYGTGILAPFSDYRAAFPITFIIDPWFTGILLSGLLVSLWKPGHRIPSVVALATLAGYVGFQAVLLHEAKRFGEAFAEREGLARASAHPMAQPLSPFNWKVVVETETGYRVATVNLREGRGDGLPAAESGFLGRVQAEYEPVGEARWREIPRFGRDAGEARFAAEGWRQPAFEGYREFARYPFVTRVDQTLVGRCAWFADLRFTLGDFRQAFPFGICRTPDGVWKAYKLEEGAPVPVH